MSHTQTQRLTEQGQDGKQQQGRPARNCQTIVKKEFIMNSKLLYVATVAIALLGSGAAMASEATQIVAPAGTLSRAEVKAELQRAQAAGELNGVSAAYGDVSVDIGSIRDRNEVRAEARTEMRTRRLASQYTGS
jgi:hypothetical protein